MAAFPLDCRPSSTWVPCFMGKSRMEAEKF